jgi:hypothetical protein
MLHVSTTSPSNKKRLIGERRRSCCSGEPDAIGPAGWNGVALLVTQRTK